MLRIIFALLLLPGLAWAQVGRIETTSGAVRIISAEGSAMAARVGAAIDIGDLVETGAGARATIRLMDDSVFAVSPNSSFEMDAFAFDETGGDHVMQASILRGAFKFASGKIGSGKKKRGITLQNATVGIRGTQLIGVNDEISQIVLLTGAIDVTTLLGMQSLSLANQAVSIDPAGLISDIRVLQPQELEVIGDRLGFDVTAILAPPATDKPDDKAPEAEGSEEEAETETETETEAEAETEAETETEAEAET